MISSANKGLKRFFDGNKHGLGKIAVPEHILVFRRRKGSDVRLGRQGYGSESNVTKGELPATKRQSV